MPTRQRKQPESEHSQLQQEVPDTHGSPLDILGEERPPSGNLKLFVLSDENKPTHEGLTMVFMGVAGSGHRALAGAYFEQNIKKEGIYTLDCLPGSLIWVTHGGEATYAEIAGCILRGRPVKAVICIQPQEDCLSNALELGEVTSREEFDASYRAFIDWVMELLKILPSVVVVSTEFGLESPPDFQFLAQRGKVTCESTKIKDHSLIKNLVKKLKSSSLPHHQDGDHLTEYEGS